MRVIIFYFRRNCFGCVSHKKIINTQNTFSAAKSLFDDDSVTATGRREAKVHFLEDDLFISTEQSDTGEINENSEHAELLE